MVLKVNVYNLEFFLSVDEQIVSREIFLFNIKCE